MKFIKLGSGDYLNARDVGRLVVTHLSKSSKFSVRAFTEDGFFEVGRFDTYEEAEKYLEELITRLEGNEK